MPTTTHYSPLSEAYARSLLDLATESGQAEPLAADLAQLRDLLQTNPTFKLFLADPAIGALERGQALEHIFKGKVSPLLYNFLGVVNEKNRLAQLEHIIDAYDALLEDQLGKIEVDVTVAHPLTPDQLEEVRRSVSAALKKDAVLHQYIDDSILGGLVLRVQDKLIDASVKSQLDAMKRSLLAARPT